MEKDKLYVSEIFHSFQGEGLNSGLNTIFLRLSECNLNCKYCDSKYHWDGKIMEIDEVLFEIKKYKSDSLTITGGEPLLQQEPLVKLLTQLKEKHIVIETNGTLMPDSNLIDLVNHFSVSPKLASTENKIEDRMNYDVLLYYNTLPVEKSIFKFVIADQKDFEEVQFLQDQLKINNRKIYLMKEGMTAEKQYVGIKEFISMCIEAGYNFSPRLHIMIYDNERGV